MHGVFCDINIILNLFIFRRRVYKMVFDKVREIICEQLEVNEEDVTMDSTMDDLEADSLDLVDIIMSLEDEFQIEISDEALESFTSVGDIVNFIEEA